MACARVQFENLQFNDRCGAASPPKAHIVQESAMQFTPAGASAAHQKLGAGPPGPPVEAASASGAPERARVAIGQIDGEWPETDSLVGCD